VSVRVPTGAGATGPAARPVPPPDCPPRRRNERSYQAILSSTLELLAELGFAGLTIDGIAARAGVGKATIYRHWPTRAELVLEAIGDVTSRPALPDTGSLRDDLLVMVEQLNHGVTKGPLAPLLASLVDAADRDPELAALHRSFSARRRADVKDILQRAIDRGELAAGTDLELAVDLLAGPVIYRRLVSHAPVGPTYRTRLVDAVLAAIGAR
jgi:AcrR family transcriptional regulator